MSLQVLADERKLYVTKVSHRSWGLHNTDDIIPGAAHLQYSVSILNLSGVCSFPFSSLTTQIILYIPLSIQRHMNIVYFVVPPYPTSLFYLLFSSGQWLCLCLSGVAVIRHNSDCRCVIVLDLLFSVHLCACSSCRPMF